MEQWPAPFVEHPSLLFAHQKLLIVFYQQKVRKNGMVEQVALRTNKIHEEDSLAVKNHSTKKAMTDSFRREYFP